MRKRARFYAHSLLYPNRKIECVLNKTFNDTTLDIKDKEIRRYTIQTSYEESIFYSSTVPARTEEEIEKRAPMNLDEYEIVLFMDTKPYRMIKNKEFFLIEFIKY